MGRLKSQFHGTTTTITTGVNGGAVGLSRVVLPGRIGDDGSAALLGTNGLRNVLKSDSLWPAVNCFSMRSFRRRPAGLIFASCEDGGDMPLSWAGVKPHLVAIADQLALPDSGYWYYP